MLELILALVVVVLGLMLWSARRHREPNLRIHTQAPLSELLPSLAGLTHSVLVEGNSVELFENGAFFDVLLADMRRAERSLHFETYLWGEGELSRRVTAALAERARAGVPVRVLIDASGGSDIGEAAPRELMAAGCQVQFFHPKRLRNLGLQNERDHRKLVVIDGSRAFIGGHCIKDEWLGEAQDRSHFRDLSVRVRGPVVQALQSTFSENWVEETGELFVGEPYFPKLEPAGDVTMHIARAKPAGAPSAGKILYHLVICLARRRITIQNPYFIPGPRAIAAFGRAVQRGVEVRVMVPAAAASDLPLVQHAAHRNFERLLAVGVRIFEYQKTLLHQKVMAIDGEYCSIGSSNYDDRSLEINDEITAGCWSRELAGELEAVFERDLAYCTEVEPGRWRHRGRLHRWRDKASYLLKYQL